jgi:hypothetical protein
VVLRKVFDSKRQRATGDWRQLCNEDFNYLYSFAFISGVGRDGRGMWHASGRITICTGFWLENLKERDFLDDLGIDGRIMLKWVSTHDERVRSEFTWLRTEATGTQKQRNALILDLFLKVTA